MKATALTLLAICNLDRIYPKLHKRVSWIHTHNFRNDFQIGVQAASTILHKLRDQLTPQVLFEHEQSLRSIFMQRCPDGEEPVAVRCICRHTFHQKLHALSKVENETGDAFLLNLIEWPDWMSQL